MAAKRKTNALTLAEYSATRKDLALKTSEELEEIATPKLVEMCRAIGVKEVRAILDTHGENTKTYQLIKDGAEFISVSSASKTELIQAIIEGTAEERENIARDKRLAELEELQKVIPPSLDFETLKTLNQQAAYVNEVNDTDIGTIAENSWKELRKYTKSLWDVDNKCWLPDDGRILRLSNSLYISLTTRVSPKTGETIQPTTALRYKTLVLKAMQEMIDTEIKTNPNPLHQEKYTEEFETYCRYVNEAFSSMLLNKNTAYQSQLNERQREIVTVKAKELVEWSRKLLAELNPDTKKTKWKDVYIALAVLTGRRSSELTSTGSFKAVGEKIVEFTGQLKTKEREDAPEKYNIPVLCPSYDVVKAMNWLEEKGKREPDKNKANQKYSKDLNLRVKEIVLDKLVAPNEEDGKVKHTLSMHSCRKLYAQICADLLRPSNITIRKYISTILGHADKDNQTATSYDADFDVIDANEI